LPRRRVGSNDFACDRVESDSGRSPRDGHRGDPWLRGSSGIYTCQSILGDRALRRRKGGDRVISRNVVIETDRLVLRTFETGDETALQQVFADPCARQFYSVMAEHGAVRSWIERNLVRYRQDGYGLWAACLRETGEVIGDCGLILQHIAGVPEVEVAYHIRADLRGRGLATEGATACLDLGFSSFGARQIVSMVHPANIASRTVASRVHRDQRRFMHHGLQYYLFFTTAHDWQSTTDTLDKLLERGSF